MDQMPFFFWVKSSDGVYIWANKALHDMAGEAVVGKTDHQLPWAENADKLVEHDNKVLKEGAMATMTEFVKQTPRGPLRLHVCKFPLEYGGEVCTAGVSFTINDAD
ncbi:hypothetical protein E1162_02055 [Rhodobacteraceae bacterium RKSG542]|nr:hypothetical protein [Pseudovibrio flavus]